MLSKKNQKEKEKVMKYLKSNPKKKSNQKITKKINSKLEIKDAFDIFNVKNEEIEED